jgi:hypothetical protein
LVDIGGGQLMIGVYSILHQQFLNLFPDPFNYR